MGRDRLAVRILGIAATIRGIAYAITEGPGCLVDVSTFRPKTERDDVAKALAAIVTKSRPLFVAFGATKAKRGTRANALDEALTRVCREQGVMILRITRNQLNGLTKLKATSPLDIAHEVALRFPELVHRLPRQRQPWEAADDRIGLFQAVAAALAAWQMFRPPRIDDS